MPSVVANSPVEVNRNLREQSRDIAEQACDTNRRRSDDQQRDIVKQHKAFKAALEIMSDSREADSEWDEIGSRAEANQTIALKQDSGKQDGRIIIGQHLAFSTT
jgi:hypothetical protein